MRRRLSFSQYLLGHASLERPPFLYAYATLWLHLILGSIVLLPLVDQPLMQLLTSMAVGSFCLAIVVYGLLARELGLLLNLGSYGASMARLFHSSDLDPLLLAASVVIALVSAYLLLSREYRSYGEEVCGETSGARIPSWISITMGIVVLLICIFALNLI